MKVSFLDFWGDLQLDNNFIFNILKQSIENITLVDPIDSDVIFCSVFGQEHHKYYGRKKIVFYTGENVRPNYNSYNKSLSFDFDDYGGKNCRLPLWYFYINWFNSSTSGNPEYLIPENYLYEPNEFTLKAKNKFCSTVFSKYDNDRFQMMRYLSDYKQVDGYGKVNPNRIPEGEKTKLDIISDYKFSICFENSIYPGYFTEKLLHAKIAGTIPIYKAHETMNQDFNPNCCLNLVNSSFEELTEKVKEIDSNDVLYKKYLEEPLFSNKIDLNEISKKIIDFI